MDNLITSKKRVLHFIESGGVYGAERVILNLSQQLKDNSEYIPIIGCIVDSEHSKSDLFDAAQGAGISAIKIPIPNKKIFTAIPKAAKQLSKMQIDLIHSHGYKSSVFGFIISKLTPVEITATCHNWPIMDLAPAKTKFLIGLEKFFYRYFKKVVAVSEPVRQILLDSNVPNGSVAIIKNGVHVPSTLPERTKTHSLKPAVIKPETTWLINVARLTDQKAQWVLVDAAAQLKEKNINAHISIIGEGPLYAELQRSIIERELENHISLLLFQPDVNSFLLAADAFVLTSTDEGMPMALLEAAAIGTPIITTLVGDIHKLITADESGLVIPTESPAALVETIYKLQNSPELIIAVTQNAHQKMVELYSSEAMRLSYTDLYRSILTTP